MPWEVNILAIDTSAIGTKILEVHKGTPEWADDIVKYLEIGNLPCASREGKKGQERSHPFPFPSPYLP